MLIEMVKKDWLILILINKWIMFGLQLDLSVNIQNAF